MADMFGSIWVSASVRSAPALLNFKAAAQVVAAVKYSRSMAGKMNLGQFIERSVPAISNPACQLVLTCGGGGAGGGGGGRQQVHGRQWVRRCGLRGGHSACARPRPPGSWRDRRLALWRRLGCGRLPISPRKDRCYPAALP